MSLVFVSSKAWWRGEASSTHTSEHEPGGGCLRKPLAGKEKIVEGCEGVHRMPARRVEVGSLGGIGSVGMIVEGEFAG